MPLTITISGDAKILGYGNGDSAFTGVERPTDPDAKTFDFSTFNGLAQILIEAPAGFTYTISGDTLQPLTSSK
jgi:beta-galactosidase